MIGVCGEALIDFTPVDVGGEVVYTPRPGGSPANVAVGLARLGKRAAFIGKLSDDRFGDMLRAHLTANRIDMRWAVRGDKPTALAFVIPRDGGAHDFAFYGGDTAEQNMTDDDVPTSFPSDVTTLHFGSYSLMLGESAHAYEGLMRREYGKRVISLDPNARPALYPDRARYRRRIERLLPYATLVKASEDDLAWLYPGEAPTDVAERWLRAGPAAVVVTLGARGAIGMIANAVVRSTAPRVVVADTVGAGDAFMSALLARLDDLALLRRDALNALTDEEIADALAYANRAAAIACARTGADPPGVADMASFPVW